MSFCYVLLKSMSAPVPTQVLKLKGLSVYFERTESIFILCTKLEDKKSRLSQKNMFGCQNIIFTAKTAHKIHIFLFNSIDFNLF